MEFPLTCAPIYCEEMRPCAGCSSGALDLHASLLALIEYLRAIQGARTEDPDMRAAEPPQLMMSLQRSGRYYKRV